MSPIDPTKIDIEFDPLQKRMRGTAVHGNTPFDVPFISHIDGNLFSGGCTDGLRLPPYIEHVVSLYPWEQYTIPHQIKSLSLNWLYDSEDQDTGDRVEAIVKWAESCVKDGPTLIHCQAGLNRSGLISALVLVRLGESPSDAIALMRERRSPAVLCNRAFERAVLAA